MSTHILAADVGGTHIRCAIIDAHGHIVHEQRCAAQLSRSDTSADDVVQILAATFRPHLETYAIRHIGIGFPGFFLRDTGILISSPNLPRLKHVPLASMLAQTLQCSVHIENDALCAAIGEQSLGAGEQATHLLHITLGTGVGAGLILNGTAYQGEHGMAAEFGHVPGMYQHGRICGCGNMDCLETYASATAISERYHEATQHMLEACDIYQRAVQGDNTAHAIISDAGHALGFAIASAVNLLDIHRITISGGLVGAWSILHPTIMQAMEQHVIAPHRQQVQVLASTLEDKSGLLGAALLTNTLH